MRKIITICCFIALSFGCTINTTCNCYDSYFNDIQSVQIKEAEKNGISPMNKFHKNKELVRFNYSFDYHTSTFENSYPYALPYVKDFLIDLSKEFKRQSNNPFFTFVVTSGLRTRESVSKLKNETKNINAVNNSCHLYGTTIDISKEYFWLGIRQDKNEDLHKCLSAALYNMRKQGRCYVKSEKDCYHITVIKPN